MNRLKAIVIAALVALYGLYFVHLAADRPGILRWVDSSVYTDEGWYGAAAVHHIAEHAWYLPHSFNPSLLVPGWPSLLRVWFALMGPGMVSARVLALLCFGVSLYCTWRLLNQAAGWVAASAGVALLLVNPYVYAFERMALLEPLVIVCTTLALWVALRKPIARTGEAVVRGLLVGALLAYGIAGKTTAVAFAPSLLVALYASSFRAADAAWWEGFQPRRLLAPAVSLATAVCLCGGYFFLLVRPYPYRLESFVAVYRINASHINLGRLPYAVMTSTWFARQTGAAMLLFAFVVVVASVVFLRRLWRQPVFVAAVLNFAGTLFLFGYRSWLIPRYYQLCLIPVAMLVALGFRELLRTSRQGVVRCVAVAAVCVTGVWMGVQTARYALHPTYTFRDSAAKMAGVMRADTGVPAVLLAASGEDITLWTGVPSWNPIWPLHGMDAILNAAHPGWYAVYLPQGPRLYPELERRYTLVETGRYVVMPSRVQQELVLYKLVPKR